MKIFDIKSLDAQGAEKFNFNPVNFNPGIQFGTQVGGDPLHQPGLKSRCPDSKYQPRRRKKQGQYYPC